MVRPSPIAITIATHTIGEVPRRGGIRAEMSSVTTAEPVTALCDGAGANVSVAATPAGLAVTSRASDAGGVKGVSDARALDTPSSTIATSSG
jgi:hypothetical protein